MTEDTFTYSSEIQTGVKNPYWDDLINTVPNDTMLRYGVDDSRYVPSSWSFPDRKSVAHRDDLVRDYSWAIPSPETVDWLGERFAGRSVVEIGAGTGYWAWMLSQKGIQVTAYDIAPPDSKPNWYHSDHEEEQRFYTQETVDAFMERWGPFLPGGEMSLSMAYPSFPAPEAPKVGDPYRGMRIVDGSSRRTWHPVLEGTPDALKTGHKDDVLLLCWPVHGDPVARDALANYQGDTLVYVGEMHDGCCADDSFFELLDKKWEPIPEDDPPYLTSWSGMHDTLITFRRKEHGSWLSRGTKNL